METGWVILILIVLMLLLALVTLIGHGIWVLLAAMFRRSPLPPEPAYAPPAPHAPPAADAPSQDVALARERSAWEITSGSVEDLFRTGFLDLTTYLAVRAAIQAWQAHDATAAPRPAPTRPPPLPVQSIEAGEPTEPDEPAGEPPPADAPPSADAPPPAYAPVPVPAAMTSETSAGAGGLTRLDAVRPSLPPRLPPVLVAPRRAPAAPPRPLSQVLASFMERKNIRWGELAGGLLIVGCSVALALSFWGEIAQRPLMKFSIFTAVTAALFALGLYSEHRWKLPTTSRGILLISTLLVPLNLLAFAAFSRGTPAADPVAMGGEAVAFALFLWLVALSARVIAPQWPLLLTAGVMTLSTASLAVRYLCAPVAGGRARHPFCRPPGCSGWRRRWSGVTRRRAPPWR